MQLTSGRLTSTVQLVMLVILANTGSLTIIRKPPEVLVVAPATMFWFPSQIRPTLTPTAPVELEPVSRFPEAVQNTLPAICASAI